MEEARIKSLTNVINKTRLGNKKADVVICAFADTFDMTKIKESTVVKCDSCKREIVSSHQNNKMIKKNAKHLCMFCLCQPKYFDSQEDEFKLLVLRGIIQYAHEIDDKNNNILMKFMMKKIM